MTKMSKMLKIKNKTFFSFQLAAFSHLGIVFLAFPPTFTCADHHRLDHDHHICGIRIIIIMMISMMKTMLLIDDDAEGVTITTKKVLAMKKRKTVQI